MIPNRWYPILEASQIKHKPVAVERMGRKFVLFRGEDGHVRCMDDRCPHRGVTLSPGRVQGNEIECPYHGFRFNGEGQCTRMPCEGRAARIPRGLEVQSFPVEQAYGLIWLWWGAEPAALGRETLPEIPWFDELPESMAQAYGSAIHWPLNYVRTIESNFDIHHGPFLHGGLIPKAATRVDPVECTVTGDRLDLHGTLRPDDGDKGRAFPFRVQFVAPSLSLLHLTDRIVVLVADCPIDGQNTWRYGRYYANVPVVGKMMAWAMMLLEWHVVQMRQDLPTVRTQTPRLPTPGCDKLVRADVGTARYLKLRRRLLQEAMASADTLPEHVRQGLPSLQDATDTHTSPTQAPASAQPYRLPVLETHAAAQ